MIVILTTRALQKEVTLGDTGSHWVTLAGLFDLCRYLSAALKLVQWSQKVSVRCRKESLTSSKLKWLEEGSDADTTEKKHGEVKAHRLQQKKHEKLDVCFLCVHLGCAFL